MSKAKYIVDNLLDDVDPQDYVDRLTPRYGIERPNLPYLPPGAKNYVAVHVWLTGSRDQGYRWTENIKKAASFSTEAEANEELRFVYTYFSNIQAGSLHVTPLPDYDMQ
jgi:hypothetical protein